jgi:hypothetical protein
MRSGSTPVALDLTLRRDILHVGVIFVDAKALLLTIVKAAVATIVAIAATIEAIAAFSVLRNLIPLLRFFQL